MLRQIEAELLRDGIGAGIVIGDFNLAARPQDGIFGSIPSKFTSPRGTEGTGELTDDWRSV